MIGEWLYRIDLGDIIGFIVVASYICLIVYIIYKEIFERDEN